MEIGYVVPTSTNFKLYDFSQVPKIVLSGDPLYYLFVRWFGLDTFREEFEHPFRGRSSMSLVFLACYHQVVSQPGVLRLRASWDIQKFLTPGLDQT